MASISELYFDAVATEQTFLAYGISLLAQRDLIDWNADESTLIPDALTFGEINAAIKQNLLGFSTISLYASKIEGNYFAFILANDEESAVKEFIRVKRRQPVFTVEVNYQMDRSMYDEQTKKTESFRDIRNQTNLFPYFVCDYEKKS